MEFSNSLNTENVMDIDIRDNSNVASNSNHTFDPVSELNVNSEGSIPQALVQIDSNHGETDRLSLNSAHSSRATTPIDNNEETGDEKDPKKRLLDDDEDEDDGRLCPICLDNWTNTGDHRICALKCGHLFGYKCVNRWLNSQQKKSCPTCKKRVNRNDLRYIYAKKLIAVDTVELDKMKQLLNEAVEEKDRILKDLSKYVCREHILNQELTLLKKQIADLTANKFDLRSFQQCSNSEYTIPAKLYMEKSLEICQQGGCRVFDASCSLDLIMTSMKSPNNLFSGFGIRKVNLSQYKPLAFLPLHTLQIRDICFHPMNNWVLTASMDKSFKVVDTISNTVMYTTSQQMPLWSCCWDATNQYVLYVGTQSGLVVKYDVRNINVAVSDFMIPGDMSPVVSVASIPSSSDLNSINGGVLCCKLNSLWLFENCGIDHVRHMLPLDGPFISMKYQYDSKQMLVSSRPNNRISHSRHTLCTLEKKDSNKVGCNIIHCFQGGGMQKLLSKSCFVSDKQEYVAAHQESNKSIYLWSINTGQRVCAIPAHEAVLDLRGIQTNNGNFLASLTEKKLEFFKFNG